jgi:hypothetical protein
MTAESTEGRPVAAWMQVLESIEEALARRLADLPAPPAPPADSGSTAKTALQVLDGRLTQMQARLDQAERDADETETVLRTEAEAYQHWTTSMTAARRRLADWAAGVK